MNIEAFWIASGRGMLDKMKRQEGDKTIRFSVLVEKSGAPDVLALWVEPERDPRLIRAKAENRIVTVRQSNTGSRRDLGEIGFKPEKLSAAQVEPASS